MDYIKKWDLYAKEYGYTDAKDMVDYLYNQEKRSVEQVAELMECSVPTLIRLMDRLGLKRRPNSKIMIPEADLMNMKVSELMSKYKISSATVWRRRRDLAGGSSAGA